MCLLSVPVTKRLIINLLSNVNVLISDANAVLKLQEHLREHRRQLEHEKGQKMLLENKQKLVAKEKNEMQK